MSEEYFVVGYSEQPVKMFFSFQDAKDSGYDFIDVFDKDGNPVSSWCKMPDGQYTTEF